MPAEDKKKEMEEKLNQLQILEQSMQTFLVQKQQFQTQLAEIDSAIEELGKSEHAYKIVGNIMIKSDKKDILEDLKKKKEILELRLKTIEKQEKNLKDKAEKAQAEVLGDMKK
jgi:prefoldin beta subunit